MRTGTTFEWDPSRIIALRKNTGIGVVDTEKNIGLSECRLRNLETGKCKPTIDDLIKMSRYFHVTINCILGLEDDPGDSYPSYEKYLRQGGIPVVRTAGFEAPWPFNIFDEIFSDPISYIPTKDQMAGLDYVISTLDDREQRCVYLYLRDGLTLDQIGTQFSVGRERIRQIIARAIRKLRHPSRKMYLIYGKEGYENMLKQAEEAKVENWKKQHIPDSPYNFDILNLEPSTRSYNCLKRAGCKTVSDVIKIIEDGSIVKVRNLGRKSILEVLALVNKITGSDYTLETVTENYMTHSKRRVGNCY